MKRMLAVLLSAALLCAFTVLPAIAEEPVAGGWTTNVENPTQIPEDVMAAFNKAVEGFTGSGLTPIAYLASQLVAGTNYCLLCQSTLVTPDAPTTYALVYVYADLEGNATISNIQSIEYDAIGTAAE